MGISPHVNVQYVQCRVTAYIVVKDGSRISDPIPIQSVGVPPPLLRSFNAPVH